MIGPNFAAMKLIVYFTCICVSLVSSGKLIIKLCSFIFMYVGD